MTDRQKFYCFSCHHTVYASHKLYFPEHHIDTTPQTADETPLIYEAEIDRAPQPNVFGKPNVFDKREIK